MPLTRDGRPKLQAGLANSLHLADGLELAAPLK